MESSTPKSQSLTSQSAWILTAKTAGFALNTLLPLLVVRYLTREDVGVYRQAFLIASNAAIVLPLGFSMSAYYFLNRERENHSAIILNILIFNLFMGAGAFGLLLFFPEILGATFQSPELTRLAPLIGLTIWLWIFSSFFETAALALQETRLAAAVIVVSQFVKTLVMILAVLIFQSVDALLYVSAGLFGLQTIVLLFYLNRRFPGLWTNLDLRSFKRQLAYALPFGFSVLLYVGQTDVHNYFVSHSFSAADFAIYSVGCFQLPLISMLYESVGAVMIPRMSQLQDQRKTDEMLELVATATDRLSFFYFPIFGYLMIVASEFITTLFTKEYAESASIFRVNLLILPLFSLVVDPVVRAFPSAARFLLRVRIFVFVVLVLIFWAGLGRLSLLEMIWIVAVAMIVEKVAAGWIAMTVLDSKPGDMTRFITTGKLAIAAAAAAAVLFAIHAAAGTWLLNTGQFVAGNVLSILGLLQGTELIGGCIFLGFCLFIYSVVYLLSANWLGAIGQADKNTISRLLRRVLPRHQADHGAAEAG